MSILKACAIGDLDEVKKILRCRKKRKRALTERDNNNWNCLHYAVNNGSVKLVEYLLQFKSLDTTAQTFHGETSLHLACYYENVSFEIVKMLLKTNKDLVNFVDCRKVNLLQCAIHQNRLDIVKYLIEHGASINHQDCNGKTALHIAARCNYGDAIKYLLYDTDCDPTIWDESGSTACYVYFLRIIKEFTESPFMFLEVIEDRLMQLGELARFTYDFENDLEDANIMVNLCYLFDNLQVILKFYNLILDLFYLSPNSSREFAIELNLSRGYFTKRITELNLSNDFNLILMLDDAYFDRYSNRYFKNRSYFLIELFTLFIENESFFYEYIAEIMSKGLNCKDMELLCYIEFSKHLNDVPPTQEIFTFLKYLILYSFDLTKFIIYVAEQSKYVNLNSNLIHILLKVLVPLSTLVSPAISLKQMSNLNFKLEKSLSIYYNFNESNNPFLDYEKLKNPEVEVENEVVSLQNLCRSTIRAYYFRKYSHYDALVMLYKLNLPRRLRNFVCYNYCNLQF